MTLRDAGPGPARTGDPEPEDAVEQALAVVGQALRSYDLTAADRVHGHT